MNIDASERWSQATQAFRSGDYAGAISDFDVLLSLGTSGPQIHGWRSMALWMVGKYQESLDAMLDAIGEDPNYGPSLHHLAYIRACCPDESLRDGVKAVRYATRACEATDWSDWLTISGLAAAYAELGDFESAVRYAEDALEMSPVEQRNERQKRIAQYRMKLPFRSDAAHDLANMRYGEPKE